MSNALAPASLILFVPVAVILHLTLSRALATALTTIGAVLFLPELIEFDGPGLPPMTKFSLSALVTYAIIQFTGGGRPSPSSLLFTVIAAMLLLGDVGTVLTNRFPIVEKGGVVLPAMQTWDIISRAFNTLTYLLLPFLIARRVYRTEEEVEELLRALTGLGFAYAFLMLVEIRFSPQMNKWVYGFYQMDWVQVMRNGGFRPTVFLIHGLATTMFLVTALFATVTLGRAKARFLGQAPLLFAGFMFLVLLLSNSLGALIYTVFLTPVVLLSPPRVLSFVASLVSVFILSIPVLRLTETLPWQNLVEFLGQYNADRAGSLGFRFEMEELVLSKYRMQPVFGYGGFCRGCLFNDLGQSESVVDSAWIIMISERGWVGFVGFFLLLLAPIRLARVRIAQIPDARVRALFGGLTMIVVVSTFELLINGLFTYFPVFFAGALFGFAENLSLSPARQFASGLAPAQAHPRAA